MNQKTNNMIFWISTSLIVIFEGIIPGLTFQTDVAKEGIRRLGYPDYFGVMLMGFRFFGVVALIVPQIQARIKEWAYAGFTIEFLSASISNAVVDGFGFSFIIPIIVWAVLIISYISFHKKQKFDHVIPGLS